MNGHLYPLGTNVELLKDFCCASPSGRGSIIFKTGEVGVVEAPAERLVVGEIAVGFGKGRGQIIVKPHQIRPTMISANLCPAKTFRLAGLAG